MLASIPCVLGAEPISFVSLAAGESISVRFASFGCFHQSVEEFEFTRGQSLTVEIFRITGRKDKPAERKSLGKLTLTDEETAGLDKLLAYYRKNIDRGCTTEDQITLTRAGAGAAKITENYKDSSCGTYEEKDLTLFTSLAQRVESSGK